MKTKKHLMVMILLIVVALATIGVGYGLWSKLLFVYGDVHTGYLDAEWFEAWCYEDEFKEVGSTTAWIDPYDYQILHFRIDNAYPYYVGGCELHYRYIGSIPVHVESISFHPGNLSECVVTDLGVGSFMAECREATVWFHDGVGLQLHYGYEVASSLRVQIEQEALQDAAYEFGVIIQLNQFNESQWPIVSPD